MSKYLFIAYLLFFLLMSVWAYRQPHYTWDVVGYVGSAVDSTDPKVIQREALNAIRNAPSDEDIRVDNPYRADVVANPYHFAEQLPFYSIKPVYVEMIRVLHRTGMPFQKSAVAISAVSDFLLAVLLWQWLAPYLSSWLLAAACTLIMLSPNILVLSRWATPDYLATLVAAVAFYLILERNSCFWGSALLVLSVWIRTDGWSCGIFCGAAFSRKLDIVGCHTVVAHPRELLHHQPFRRQHGWSALFYNSFLGG
jgi:hypothetical protein